MKKSERKKVKLLMLKYVSQKVDAAKEDLAATWTCKGVPGAVEALSVNIKILHGALFVKRAVEKQMPMPMIVKVIYSIHKLSDGTIKQYVFKDNFCPCCGNYIIGAGTPKHRAEKYCYQCGQKLWWPSC